MSYENIEVRIEAEKVGIVTLNRPKALNALNDALKPATPWFKKFGLAGMD